MSDARFRPTRWRNRALVVSALGLGAVAAWFSNRRTAAGDGEGEGDVIAPFVAGATRIVDTDDRASDHTAPDNADTAPDAADTTTATTTTTATATADPATDRIAVGGAVRHAGGADGIDSAQAPRAFAGGPAGALAHQPGRGGARWASRALATAAIAVGAAAVWAFTTGDDSVVLDVATVTAAVAPSTIAPDDEMLPAPPTTPPPGDPPSPTSAPSSPLAARLGPAGSAIPPKIEPRVRPVGMSIAAIDMDGPIRAVGLEDDGQLELPDETEVGWYRYGSAPGLPGATVLAAHVSWNGQRGPFYRLGHLEPGDRMTVDLDDGGARTYQVVERTMYDKRELPRARIWRTTGSEELVLITCGGDFNPEIRHFRQNIVVYAVPVASAPGAITH